MLPGDPLVHLIGEETYAQLEAHKPQALAEMRARYGLERPLSERYLRTLGDTLRWRLGWSFQYGRPVAEILNHRLKWTLLLMVPALGLSAILGLLLGGLAGRPGRNRLNRSIGALSLAIYATPAYCLAFLVLLVLAFSNDYLPLGGMPAQTDDLTFRELGRYLAMPLTVLVLHNTAYLTIIMRAAVRQVYAEDFVLTARAKGLSPRAVRLRHVLLNALPPYVAAVAINFGFIVSGALLVEVVFAWQGMGGLMYEAVLARDYPVLSGCFLVIALAVIAANMLADLLVRLIDPRVRDNATLA
jgi:peptide/nickel transport system permease protein